MNGDAMQGDDTILFSFEAVSNSFGAYGALLTENVFFQVLKNGLSG